MRAYLCGPMTGMQEYNFPAFRAATADLRQKGWSVFDPSENPGNSNLSRAHFMALDIRAIVGQSDLFPPVDAVVVLPGWEKSRGARLEVEIALQLDIPVLWAYNLNPVTNLQFEQARAWTHDSYLLPEYQGVPA